MRGFESPCFKRQVVGGSFCVEASYLFSRLRIVKPVRIFTHLACEPPGYLALLLEKLGVPYQQVCIYDGDQVQMDLHRIAGLVIMGGPGNVNQPTLWMQQEIELIQKAVVNEVPVLGICLGAQLMSKSLGGQVHPGKFIEVGWHQVELLPEAANNACFSSVDQVFPVFQWHAHVFTAPPKSTALAVNACGDCQAFSYQNNLAVQFHLEMTAEIIRGLMRLYGSDLTGDSDCTQSSMQILENIEVRSRQVNSMADTIFTPWFHSLYH